MTLNYYRKRIDSIQLEIFKGDYTSLLGAVYTSNADASLVENIEQAKELAHTIVFSPHEIHRPDSVDYDDFVNMCALLDYTDPTLVDCVVTYYTAGSPVYVIYPFAIH